MLCPVTKNSLWPLDVVTGLTVATPVFLLHAICNLLQELLVIAYANSSRCATPPARGSANGTPQASNVEPFPATHDSSSQSSRRDTHCICGQRANHWGPSTKAGKATSLSACLRSWFSVKDWDVFLVHVALDGKATAPSIPRQSFCPPPVLNRFAFRTVVGSITISQTKGKGVRDRN